MRALQENGYKIPEDISVMGFDNTELSGYTNPPLTTVNAPVYAMGIYGIRFILNMMKSKSTDYFSPMRVYLPCPIKKFATHVQNLKVYNYYRYHTIVCYNKL